MPLAITAIVGEEPFWSNLLPKENLPVLLILVERPNWVGTQDD